MGPDNLHPKFLKECASVLAEPLTIMFNKSLKTGNLPEDWKSSIVTPIFKKGDKRIPGNYCPVSLTSQISKILEKCLREKILNHLKQENIISGNQHGFTRGRSCLTNLLESLDTWTDELD